MRHQDEDHTEIIWGPLVSRNCHMETLYVVELRGKTDRVHALLPPTTYNIWAWKSMKKACGMGHVLTNMFEALYTRVRASEN